MASYFVELVKCEFPNAFVGYFFCKTGENGLTKAGDIIRTLAYQFVIDDTVARKELDAVRSHGKLDANIGIGFLFEKLLEGLFTRSKKQVFIILDGLDESNWNDLDKTTFPPRSEVEIFLKYLCALPIRVLLISRPDIFRITPKTVQKRLTQNVNTTDIETYILKTIEESEELKANFNAHPDIVPIKFLREKANGIFLWVVIVLHQLKQIQDTVTFKKYVAEFADASGSMETLYSRVLSRFESSPLQPWVQETLQWVVVMKTEISLELLKEVVERSLSNTHIDFKRFLEVECGALLELTPNKDSLTVHLIHETLGSFLVSSKSCPLHFHVDVNYTHYHACCVCLDIIGAEAAPKQLSRYALGYWWDHLGKALESQRQYDGVLGKIYNFFHSDYCTKWIKSILSTYIHEGILGFSEEEPALKTVWRYLQKFEGDTLADSMAVLWRSEVVEHPSKLAEEIGIRAVQIWLYEEQDWGETADAFRLALKYHCKEHGPRVYLIESLQELATGDFSSFYEESPDPQRCIKVSNLGIGFFVLRLGSEVP